MAAIQRPPIPLYRVPSRFRSGRLLVALAAIALVSMAVVQVHQLSQVTSTGYRLEELRRERAAMQAENHRIEAEVATLTSLGTVLYKARALLGMVPSPRRQYIEVNHPLPQRAPLPAVALDQPDENADTAQ